ncbi:putative fatty acid amide hydrolase [Helianthus annuus]|nr:putative fatty acid amide hydrolase [Helianthus annuus]
MGKKKTMLPATEVDLTTVKYDPGEIEAPYINGFWLKLFVKLVEMPLLGSLIIDQLKKQNKMNEVCSNSDIYIYAYTHICVCMCVYIHMF